MALKERFLSYVEMHKNVNQIRSVKGSDHPNTVDAYQELNEIKREILNMIEDIESKK